MRLHGMHAWLLRNSLRTAVVGAERKTIEEVRRQRERDREREKVPTCGYFRLLAASSELFVLYARKVPCYGQPTGTGAFSRALIFLLSSLNPRLFVYFALRAARRL